MSFGKSEFTVIIPFYNEEAFLERTLRSWAEQERLPDRIILVDNASKDKSVSIAESFQRQQAGRIPVLLLEEPRPGKVHALNLAQKYLTGEWGVFCDADTWYPPHYLRRAGELIEKSPESVVSVMAIDLPAPPNAPQSRRHIFWKMLFARFFVGKCHTGGFGQIFRVSALRKSGGFGARYWGFVLMDHEVVSRILRFGKSLYHPDLWCLPSPRRNDRKRVRWTVWERLLYFVHPFFLGNWFFHRFLRGNFLKRRLRHLNLRQQPWNHKPVPS